LSQFGATFFVGIPMLSAVLRKEADQFNLFGGVESVAPTPKARQRSRLQEQWGKQQDLFSLDSYSAPLKPKTAIAPLKPKAPKTPLAPKAKVGDRKFEGGISYVFNKNYRWQRADKGPVDTTPRAAVAQPQGLAVLPSTPAPAPTPAAPVESDEAKMARWESMAGDRGRDSDSSARYKAQLDAMPPDERKAYLDWKFKKRAFDSRSKSSKKGAKTKARRSDAQAQRLQELQQTPEGRALLEAERNFNTTVKGNQILDAAGFDRYSAELQTAIAAYDALPKPAPEVLTPVSTAEPVPLRPKVAEAEPDFDKIRAAVQDGVGQIFSHPKVLDRIALKAREALELHGELNIDVRQAIRRAVGESPRATHGEFDAQGKYRQLQGNWSNDQISTITNGIYQALQGIESELEAAIAQATPAPLVTAPPPSTLRPKVAEAEPAIAPDSTPPPEPSIPTELGVNADFASTTQQKQRLKVNRQVKKLLKEKPEGPYTKDELTLLAKYSGKGGITDDDGSLSEYYTRPDVAKFTADLLRQNGYKGGTVLEPSCGNGVFLHQFKSDPNTLAVGVELDSTSGAAAAALNPQADVTHGVPFERFLLDNPDFTPDAIVGNVPFGTRTVVDLEAFRKVGKGWKDNGDFFVHESLSRLKPGGTLSLIVPHGITTGSNHQRLRDELMKQGRVVGAYRLPSTAFEHTGTSTITDVLVIQKHPDAVLNAIAAGDHLAIDATRDDSFIQGKYFEANPQNVLGTVRATKNQFGGDSFTVDGAIEDALQQAKPLVPAVTYEGLDVPTADDQGAKVGDEKYISGRLYRLDGNPPRWHLVEPGEGVAADEGIDPSAYGVDSMAAAEATLRDVGQRVMIHPDRLRAYTTLAGDHLDRADVTGMMDAAIAVDAVGSTADKEKLAHAMLLAGHLQLLQKLGTDDVIHLEQALNMLQRYRELHGNPAGDRAISGLVDRFPVLLHLQGAFGEDGQVSDYFADHDAVVAQAKRSHSDAGAAMGEAYRAGGGEPVTLADIRQHLESNLDDEDLEAALAADPTVGYMGGTYRPLDRLLVGNGFNLIDAMLMESEGLPEGAPLRRKLEEQIGTVRSRLQPRAMDDITTPFWAVGSWIPAEALNQYLADRDYALQVRFNPLRSEWENTSDRHPWGTAEDILTTLNRGRISHGQNTKEAKEAIAALEQDFGQWIAGSDYRLQVEEAYNQAFNGDLPQEFSGEPLEIALFDQHDGVDGGRAKRLHDYQTSTIRQMAEQGRGIIALGVGLGKTASAIGLALHLKELGRAKKPTFVVPKSVLANWVREIDFWAPGANVTILGQTQQFWASGEPMWEVPGYKVKTKGGNPAIAADGSYILTRTADKVDVTMSPEQVKKISNLAFKDDDRATKERKMRQLSQNSYDIVLMSEPVFQDIGLNPDKEKDYLDDISQGGSHINPDSKNTHKDLERLEAARRRLAERSGEKTDNITFEDLGIDALFHDEAHHAKNLMATQRTGDVAFLSQAQSNRALDFYYKARYIREQNNNQNTYLLTATPTTNNPLEAFNMLQHVCPEEFEARGIRNVDDFLGMFGKIESVTVPGVDLEMTEKNGLVGFKNLRDLRHLFNKYTRMQSAKDVGLPIPEEATQDHYVNMTAAQKEVYEDLKIRAQKVADDEDDHIFSIISDMDKAAIDLNYYNASSSGKTSAADIPEGERSPKIAACADQVMSSRKANQGKQIVFCDAIQLHADLKQQLVDAGYPEDEIAIVNAGTVPKSSDRQKISQAYNDGRITMVIGNTATMGEGMNFQIGTTDIHHLTTPWTPAAIEQRNGRGVRQGNSLDEVGCHYYHAKGSFDGYRKGVVERKRGWIDDLWRGDADEADNQNTGGLSMDDIELMMSDDPEAAAQKHAANKELQMARHKEKMTGAALKAFGQAQTMKLALSKMQPEARNSERGRALEARLRAATEALSRNEHFPHKDLLDGSTPAYVGTDGTVVKVGDHLQKNDGSVFRVDHVDLSGNKFTTTMVSGSNSTPTSIKADPTEFGFDRVAAKTGSYNSVKPVSFDNAAHAERVINSIDSYSEIARLDPDTINANRDRLLDRVKAGGYSQVPYLDPESGLVKEAKISSVPEGGRVLFPHDGEALEHLVKTMAHPHAEAEWKYHGIAEKLSGGRRWHSGLGAELKPRIEAYREQHAAMAEQGPKEGENKTFLEGSRKFEGGVEYELRGGRWHRVGEDEPAAPTPASAPEPTDIKGAIAAVAELSNPTMQRALEQTLAGDLIMGADATALRASVIDMLDKGQRLGHVRPLSAEKKEAIADGIAGKISPQPLTPVSIPAVEAEPAEPAIAPAPAAISPRTPTETPPPHPDPLKAIRDALVQIEQDDQDDRGAERNDMGWSAFTRDFGRSLAQQVMGGGDLTPNQYRKAWEMLTRRHRPQAGHQATTEELNAVLGETYGDAGQGGGTGSMKLVGGEIHIKRPYNKTDLDKFRMIPGRRWDRAKEANVIPVASFKDALEHFPEAEMDIDPAIFEHPSIHEEPEREAMGAGGVVKLVGGEYRVSFPYDRATIAQVKSLTRGGRKLGRWNGSDKTWRFPGDQQTLDILMNEFPSFDLQKSARRYTFSGVPYEFRRLANNAIALCRAEVNHAI
jgi:SNF2 family DNA or RNA helicase